MPTIRQDTGLELIPRKPFQGDALSFVAKGILAEILTVAEGEPIPNRFADRGHENSDVVSSAFKLLEEQGYITRDNGRLVVHWEARR